jgi:hypothetical protein
MLGIRDSSIPNLVIPWSVMLEGQRVAADHQNAVDVTRRKVAQPSDHRAKPGVIDTSGYSCGRPPAIPDLNWNARGKRLDWL